MTPHDLSETDALILLVHVAKDAVRRLGAINTLACEDGFVGTDLSARILMVSHNAELAIAVRRAEAALAADADDRPHRRG